MVTFTDRELESLVSLRDNWSRLYWNELVRLLQESDDASDSAMSFGTRAAAFTRAGPGSGSGNNTSLAMFSKP